MDLIIQAYVLGLGSIKELGEKSPAVLQEMIAKAKGGK